MSTGSISSNSSAFSFCHLTSSLDDDDFGGTALSSENGVMCAMKEVSLSSDGDKNQSARMLEKEIALLSRMRHPNIVQYYGSEMVDGKFCIYYEYMSRGSVYMILEQYGRLGESAIRSYTQHILSGLAYMHSKSIAHGDIKGANILLDPNGRVKLTNFGIEKQIAEKFHISWLMDSPYWMAPEVIMNPNVRNPAVDIWSLGCTVLEMATSKPPLSQYEGVMAMFKVAYHKELPTIPDHLSDVCKDFLRHCLQWNPLHRPTAFQLLEHPFVKGLSPSGERILVSASSDHSAVANSVKPEGRNPHELDSGKVVSSFMCDVYTPRNILVGSSPLQQQLSRQNSTRTGGSGSGNQSTLYDEETFKQSPNNYWDPRILQGRGMFRVS
ncbi:Protein kinase superfamily protein [Perilla frutescens var. frutescens]|nr:Protein kinase superfamily protein [Perilla frutescens var. frutescens]